MTDYSEKIIHLKPTERPAEELPMQMLYEVREVLDFHGLNYISTVDLMMALWGLIPAEKRPRMTPIGQP